MKGSIALAIPVFFVLIGLELAWARARGRRVYRFADSVTDVSCGIASQLAVLFFAGVRLGAYARVYEHYRLVTFDGKLWPWLLAFFGVDLAYYWWHRLSHEVNVLWAAHVVHHQSEDYNLSVALRQAVVTSWTSLPFYLPLALLGVPPLVFGPVRALSTAYQFWIHTQLIPKRDGLFHRLLNMPSHHRVHHAINPPYLDKNYGATLIVWDRLFGTYAEEREPPVYGITRPLASYNPLWAQVHYWVELVRRTPHEGLSVWWRSPASGPLAHSTDASPIKYGPEPSARVKIYVFMQFLLLVGTTLLLLFFQGTLSLPVMALATLAVLLGTAAFGALLEGRRWAIPAEVGRLALSAALLIAWTSGVLR